MKTRLPTQRPSTDWRSSTGSRGDGTMQRSYSSARAPSAKKNDPDKVIDTVNDLGLLYWAAGRYAEAEPLLKQAVDQYTARYGAK